jgi:hypothetical protein
VRSRHPRRFEIEPALIAVLLATFILERVDAERSGIACRYTHLHIFGSSCAALFSTAGRPMIDGLIRHFVASPSRAICSSRSGTRRQAVGSV